MKKHTGSSWTDWFLIALTGILFLAALIFPAAYSLAYSLSAEEQKLLNAYQNDELIRLHIIANKQQKQFLILYNRTPEAITDFYDDHIKSTSITNKEEITIEYDKIIKLKQTKNLYLLTLKEKIILMIDKNNFEKGTCEDFEKFIISKSVNAKNKL